MKGLRPLTIAIAFALGLIVTTMNRALFGPQVDNFALELLVLLAVGFATASFEADDPPRGAWMLLTIAVGLLTTAHVLTPFTRNTGTVSARHVFTFAHNVVWVAAFWRFHLVFRRGGIARPWTPTWRIVFPSLVACAVSIAAWGIWRQVEPLLKSGAPTSYDLSLAMVNASSGVADAFVLVIAVDLARTLLPLRGGTLSQPYALLAFGAAGLLAIDLVGSITQVTSLLVLGPMAQYLIALAWTSVAVAALSQTRIIRGAISRPSR